MSIHIGDRKIAAIYKGDRKIAKVYKGDTLMYSSARLPSEYQEVKYLQWGPYTSGYRYFVLSNAADIDAMKEVLYSFDAAGKPDTSMLISNGDRWLDNRLVYIRRHGLTTEGTIAALNQGQGQIIGNSIYYGCYYQTFPESWSVATVQMQELVFYKNNQVTNDYIPCYRKIDGEVGLYDLVSHIFFTNQGSGKFVPGPNVN